MNQSHDATCLPSISSDNDGHTECAPSPLPREPAGECTAELTLNITLSTCNSSEAFHGLFFAFSLAVFAMFGVLQINHRELSIKLYCCQVQIRMDTAGNKRPSYCYLESSATETVICLDFGVLFVFFTFETDISIEL